MWWWEEKLLGEMKGFMGEMQTAMTETLNAKLKETREANDGRQILYIRPKDKILANAIGEATLIGLHQRAVWDRLSIPIRGK